MTDSDGVSGELIEAAKAEILEGGIEAYSRIATQLKAQGLTEMALANLRIFEHQTSLRRTEEHKDAATSDGRAWRAWAETLRRAHRLPESAEALRAAINHCPDDLILRKQITERYLGARCYTQATSFAEDALVNAPGSPDLLRLVAELLSRTHSPKAAVAASEAWEAQPELWPRFLDIMLRAGSHDLARTRLAQMATLPQHTLRAQGALARLDLWAGDPDPALSAGQALIDADPADHEGHFLRGAGRALKGTPGALQDLEHALSNHNSKTTWVERSAIHGWLCELALEHGDLDRALLQADKAMSSSEHYSANALLSRHRVMNARHLAAKSRDNREHASRQNWFQRLFSFMGSGRSGDPGVDPRWLPVVNNYGEHTGSGPREWNHKFTAFSDMLSFIHGHIGGNRSSISTWLDSDGTLSPISAQDYSHIGTRSIQQQLQCRPHAEVVGEFVSLCEQHPNHPGVHTYCGETLVWLGEYARSEDFFRAALTGDYTTVWAWIGLGAARGFQGHLEEGIEIFEEGIEKTQFEGPSVFVYRGEFHRILGNWEDAERDLNKAVQHKPQRLSAWINRVLLDAEHGNDVPLNALTDAIKQTNPGLWCDAAEAAGADPADTSTNRVVMDTTLQLMRGNRSSQVLTYRLQTGELRFARWSREDPPKVLCDLYGVASD